MLAIVHVEQLEQKIKKMVDEVTTLEKETMMMQASDKDLANIVWRVERCMLEENNLKKRSEMLLNKLHQKQQQQLEKTLAFDKKEAEDILEENKIKLQSLEQRECDSQMKYRSQTNKKIEHPVQLLEKAERQIADARDEMVAWEYVARNEKSFSMYINTIKDATNLLKQAKENATDLMNQHQQQLAREWEGDPIKVASQEEYYALNDVINIEKLDNCVKEKWEQLEKQKLKQNTECETLKHAKQNWNAVVEHCITMREIKQKTNLDLKIQKVCDETAMIQKLLDHCSLSHDRRNELEQQTHNNAILEENLRLQREELVINVNLEKVDQQIYAQLRHLKTEHQLAIFLQLQQDKIMLQKRLQRIQKDKTKTSFGKKRQRYNEMMVNIEPGIETHNRNIRNCPTKRAKITENTTSTNSIDI